MLYDLVIKNGLIVDGSGGPGFYGDVGIINGKIAMIGRIQENGSETIDAEGQVVSPGFVDGHTHMDAQVFWDKLGTSSCYHGITSAVMGNCGFTLAPCREDEAEMVFRNLERAEDISPAAMKAGIKWSWETYPEYLDTLESLPKGINYAGYIGHSALRTYVMGERAFTEQATEDELAAMAQNVQDAVRAGAIGFSTSRIHQLQSNQPVASAVAEWNEVRTIVNAMSQAGAGVFELAGEQTYRDPVLKEDYFGRQLQLAVESGVPYTWGLISGQGEPQDWRYYLQLLEDTAAAGGRMFAQVHTRALWGLQSFESRMPLDSWDHWKDIRVLPLEEQKVKLRDPAIRSKLIDIATDTGGKSFPNAYGFMTSQPPNWDRMLVMDSIDGEHRPLTQIAAERGVRPPEAMIDVALEHDLKLFFRGVSANSNDDDVIAMMKHPHTVVTFSDSGAHVGQIIDASLQTHLFSHWVRKKQAVTLEEAVRMVTYEPSARWGLHDRGLLRMGLAADILIFDPDTIGPDMPTVEHDLPAGEMRLKQTSHGIAATIVNGQVLLRDNEHTGAQPGRVLRGPLAQTTA